MVDHLTLDQRHDVMSKIRSKDTIPEKIVRSTAHKLGYRFRLHRKDLPGKPDLVFPRLGKVVFVHGCFWHKHKCKSLPKTNVEFWTDKLKTNALRDRRNIRKLRKLGWSVLVIWECRTKDTQKLRKKLLTFLEK